MTVPPESIEVGKCYLTRSGEIRRVLLILPHGPVHYEARRAAILQAFGWHEGVLELALFAALIEREVPCDWTPEADGQKRHLICTSCQNPC